MGRLSYHLSPHAYFCLADNHYVFLDLRSDAYLCLGRKHTDAIKGKLNGHCVADEHSEDARLRDGCDSDSDAVIQALLKKGLLLEGAASGKPATPLRMDLPLASMVESSEKLCPQVRPVHVWNFFASTAGATMNLRWQTIERTVRTVAARKSAHKTGAIAEDYGAITDLFMIFEALRPYYPRPYLCLFDSLALMHFLARFGIFPQWVYGVKLEPFAAHCWVQVGKVVVNDIVDNVRDYTPIMCV